MHKKEAMTSLSVNINKIATLRNARGGHLPDVILAAQKIQSFGAHGITVHPRPDERHIRYQDVYELKPVIFTELNIEGYPHPRFLDLIQKVQPQQVTLVPDGLHVLTSNAGWDILTHKKLLQSSVKSCSPSRVSVFVEPQNCSSEDLKYLSDLGVQRIEMYTEAYAKAYETQKDFEKVLSDYQRLAEKALKLGLEINAGHDLNQKNLARLIKKIPQIKEVSIGHALICEALYEGLESTIKQYLKIL